MILFVFLDHWMPAFAGMTKYDTVSVRVAWIFGQRPKRQKHASARIVRFAKANNFATRGVLQVRRSGCELKRNTEIGLTTTSSSHYVGARTDRN